MKRLVLAIALLAGITAACIYSAYYVWRVKEEVYSYTNAVFTAIDEKKGKETRESVEVLVKYWKKEAPILVRFVRHAHVDEVTRAMAKLESFAKYESFSDLRAELGLIVWMMENIWQSELPKLGNIL